MGILEDVIKHVIIFLYITSFLVGVSGITLSVLLAKKYGDMLYKQLRTFVVVFFLYEVSNFIVFYRAFFTSHWEMNAIIMFSSDICLMVLLYTWVRLVGKVSGVEVENRFYDKGLRLISVMYVLVGLFVYLYGLDQNSNLSFLGKVLNIGMESIISVFAIGGSAFYLLKGLKVAEQLTKKVLLTLSAAMYLFIFLLYSEDLYLDFWDSDFLDFYAVEPIAVLYLLLNALFIIYVFKEDLLINATESAGGGRQSIEDISTQYWLTDREKEVLLMVYEGHSNLKIADMLCISPFTVKRHINNIFRKTAVKSRVELMHLVITAK